MRSYSALIITLLLFIFCLYPGQVLSQCKQQVSAKAIKVNSDQSGSFDLSVVASGVFTGQLVQITGTSESKIELFTGSGTKNFSFKNLRLAQEEIYRVVVEFEDEGAFLCKRKVLEIEFANR